MALSLNGQRGFQSVTTASFEKLISLLGLETATGRQIVSDAGRSAIDAWHREDVRDLFSAEQITRIADHLAGLPFVKDAVPCS